MARGQQPHISINDFALKAERSLHNQLKGKVRPGSTCLVTALEDVRSRGHESRLVHGSKGENESFRGWMSYLVRHTVFVQSLLRHHPNLSTPLVILSREGHELSDAAQRHLRRVYAHTHFVATPIPPFERQLARSSVRPLQALEGRGGKQYIEAAESPEAQRFFYARLQLFALTSCETVIALDTGDMLVTAPFIDAARAEVRADEHAEESAHEEERPPLSSASPPAEWIAAAAACTAAQDFAAPRLCSRSDVNYFNGGFFVVTRRCLGAATYAALLRVAIAPLRPSRYLPRLWQSDQDTLNCLFDAPHHTRLPFEFNLDKRYLLSPSCAARKPRLLHYVGTKPSVPLSARMAVEADEYIVAAEMPWWAEYLSDKTVIVGAGPSASAPLGRYIDAFGSVIRLNDFSLGADRGSGRRTTHAFIHKATKPARSYNLSKLVPASRLHVAGFGESRAAVQARMLAKHRSGCGIVLGTHATLLPEYYDADLSKELGLAQGKHALIGTVALAWARRQVRTRPIFVVGLDMVTSEAAYTHADASDVSVSSISRYHDLDAERLFMHQLVESGEVRLLDATILGHDGGTLRHTSLRGYLLLASQGYLLMLLVAAVVLALCWRRQS